MRETKRKLLELLIEAKRAGKRIAGYGAPGKGNTLLNYCGIRTRLPRLHGRPQPLQAGQVSARARTSRSSRPRRSTRPSPTTSSSSPGTSRTRSWPSSPTSRELGRRSSSCRFPKRPWSDDADGARSAPAGAPLRILCLGAHCDDIEIGCGGTRAAAARRAPGLDGPLGRALVDARARARGAGERGRLPGRRRRPARSSIKSFRESYFPFRGAEVKDFFEALKPDGRPDLDPDPPPARPAPGPPHRSPS